MPGLDTQVLSAFNPKDKHYYRAMRLLEKIKKGELGGVYVTDTALLSSLLL